MRAFNVTMFIILIALVFVIEYLVKFSNEETCRHTIQSIDKVENVSGGKGYFSTSVYYIVTTDKGIFHIETSGFNAHPECAAVKKDSTYALTIRGITIPYLGIYSSIIGYRKINE